MGLAVFVAYFDLAECVLASSGSRRVFLQIMLGLAEFCAAKHTLTIPDEVWIRRTSGLVGFQIIFSMDAHLIMPSLGLSGRFLRGNGGCLMCM